MDKYKNKLKEIYDQIGDHAKIVLATSSNNRVSARKMSFIIIDGKFYFQTDITFRKYNDIKENPNVALCIDNIQIEGKCKELEHPLKHQEFSAKFKEYYRSSYDAYTSLDSERLFVIEPCFIQRWNYVNNKPVIEQLDFDNEYYKERYY